MTDQETQLALDKIKQLTDEERYNLPAEDLERLFQFEWDVSNAECWLEGALEIYDLSILAPYQRCAEKYFPEKYREIVRERQQMKKKEEQKEKQTEKFVMIMNITLLILVILGVIILFIFGLVS